MCLPKFKLYNYVKFIIDYYSIIHGNLPNLKYKL